MTTTIRRETCFTLQLEDKPGALTKLAVSLKESNVSLQNLWGFATTGGKGQAYLVPTDIDKFRKTAEAAGWSAKECTCFSVSGQDRAGALVDTLDRISSLGVNLLAVDAVGLDGKFACYLWTNEADASKVAAALNA